MSITPSKASQLVHAAHSPEQLAEALEVSAPLNLRDIAFENYHATVFHAWLKLVDDERQEALRDRYIFFSICCHIGAYLDDLVKIDSEKANGIVAEIMGHVSFLSQGQASFSEEWFRGLDRLVETLTDKNYVPEARSVVATSLRTGVNKFPGIAQTLAVHAAYLDALIGRRDKAAKVALRLVRKPFLLPNQRELPRLYQRLMYILAASNHIAEYKLVLWEGVSRLHTDAKLRDTFSEQIVKTYRGAFRTILHREIPAMARLCFLLGNLARITATSQPLAFLRAHIPLRWLHMASLLGYAFLRKRTVLVRMTRRQSRDSSGVNARFLRLGRAPVKRILVTRAMGGIGDLLMMTPGLKALAKKYPDAEIHFAIPKSFHPILDEFDAVRLLDINEGEIDLSSYHRWINLTNCPAGRVESRQYPNVRKNRIEIFAQAMGVSKRLLKRATGFQPFYRVTPEESSWAEEYLRNINPLGRPVIGVQPFAADSYKNWAHMESLVKDLSADNLVFLFHHEDINGFAFENVIQVKQSFRRCAALVSQCSRLVVVDSSFLHLSGALDIPTIALFFATSGSVFTRHYANVRIFTPEKSDFPCYPCWRNEHKPCHLTNGRESICARSIPVKKIIEALKSDPAQWRVVESGLWKRSKEWVLYGRE